MSARSVELDALRALALLGVAIVNYATVFRGPLLEYLVVFHTRPELGHRVADWIVGVGLESKAFAVFAALFGAGMRAWTDARRPLARRLLVLLGIGALHMAWWDGDILLFYAVLGLALTPVAASRARPALLLALAAALFALDLVPGLAPDVVPDPAARQRWIAAAREAYQGRDVAAMFAFRAREAAHVIAPLLAGVAARTAAFMLVGMAAWSSGVARAPAAHRGLLARVCVVGLAIGAAATTADVAGVLGAVRLGAFARAAQEIGIAGLAAGYGAGALFALAHALGAPRGARAVRWLARLGRISLTSYVLQSIVGALVFYGIGLARFDRVGSLTAALLGAAVWAVEGALAPRIARFGGQGPLERVWRRASGC